MRPARFDVYAHRGASRWTGLVLVLGLHAAALAVLFTYEPARQALGLKPMMVEFITPPAPPQPEPPKETPKPRVVPVAHKTPEPPKPQPVIAARTEAPAPAAPAPEVARPLPPVEAAPPPTPAAPPAPPAAPRLVSGVEYLRAPQPVYPALARRMNEQGKVILRVLVDVRGHAERVVLQQSSGSTRLDDAARAAASEALFKPYLDNGQPVAVWAVVPISFSLNS